MPNLPPALRARLERTVTQNPEILTRAGSSGGLEGLGGGRRGGLEAIILAEGRPSFLISDGAVPPSADLVWGSKLAQAKSRLGQAIASVGRVNLYGSHIGTGWMIAPGIVATNRHVAELFAEGEGTGARLAIGYAGAVSVDFVAEAGSFRSRVAQVSAVRYVAPSGDDQPDIALLAVTGADLPEPLTLSDKELKNNQEIVVIGFPADEQRDNRAVDMKRIFGAAYGVKRLAPGTLMEVEASGLFQHDASTLAGSSGSAVIDLRDGTVVGIHFSGASYLANYGWSWSKINAALSAAQIRARPVVVAEPPPAIDTDPGPASTGSGYDDDFLGTDELVVPLPRIPDELLGSVTRLRDGSGHVLRYHHFSVVMHKTRRMALFTAVNLDGAQAKSIKRRSPDKWVYDPRIHEKLQLGRGLYDSTDFDFGHLVRRLDPAWGRKAAEAERDTFFLTNAAPQAHIYNTGVWGQLENYLLNHAKLHDFRASVFTGPVFRDSDPDFRFRDDDGDRTQVQVPMAFWKVVVMTTGTPRRLHATAYLLSQDGYVTSEAVEEAPFVYGAFKTWQVPIAKIGELTGLSLDALSVHDPLRAQESASTVREITRLERVVVSALPAEDQDDNP